MGSEITDKSEGSTEGSRERSQPGLWRRWISSLIAALGLGFVYVHYGDKMPRHLTRALSPESGWHTLVPSEDITWTSCFDEFLCAFLKVPLDYLSDHPNRETVNIALQMLPAADPRNVKGTILMHPGGPGVSATSAVRRWGKYVQLVAGGNYNVLGFDSRGSGASTPSAQCFASELHHQVFGMRARNNLISLKDGSTAEARAWEQLVAEKCVAAIGGNSTSTSGKTTGVGSFLSSASAATDLLNIIDKLGQDKLHYWGFSYGAVLGQYFAAMYPNKVGRMLLDGACDAKSYIEAQWRDNLIDTDAVEESFYTFCHEAGPEKCPLYEASPSLIRSRAYAIRDTLRRAPIPVHSAEGPTLLTDAALDHYMFGALYFPVKTFSIIADILVAAEKRDQEALADLAAYFSAAVSCDCDPDPGRIPSDEALAAIACSDANPVSYEPQSYKEFFGKMSADSPRWASIWVHYHLRCTEWRIRAKWRYTGSFGASNTSNPLLIVSPRYDTVCPLSHARAVQARFPGSALLVQESFGHCVPTAPSLCSAKRIRAYFQNGELPEDGAVCGVDEVPFVGETVTTDLSEDDRQLLDELKVWARVLP